MTIAAGPLDRRLKIEQPVEARNDFGEPITTWQELVTVWGRKRDITARERFTAQQRIGEETTRFVIRYRSDLTPKMRLLHDGKTYDIEGLAELGRREGLEITATARNV